ncbi:hypothetical protein PSTT_00589 [Puccinia striiformis]|uniref:Uncharacterized protein n=1 Tax=Puccinia striiformis TaxID=27350 RepID=A0A2S4W667_9BASI|nr:hypothetical protein PSTT_00589 [Puccinia striiformis]
MSSTTLYSLDGFLLYLMPEKAAPVCPLCQPNALPSVFEDDEDDCKSDKEMNVVLQLSKVFENTVLRAKVSPCLKFSSPNVFSSNLLE